jgi:hypothetical protein
MDLSAVGKFHDVPPNENMMQLLGSVRKKVLPATRLRGGQLTLSRPLLLGLQRWRLHIDPEMQQGDL